MEIVRDQESFERYIREAVHVSGNAPLLLDRYLTDASEVDVDAVCDGDDVWVAGIMEHIEPAGIHSGDSSAVLPTYSLSVEAVNQMVEHTRKIAFALNIRGLINIQFAIKGDQVYVIEANPRASRTTPFIAKAYQVPYLQIATKVMMGTHKLKDFNIQARPGGYAIKVPVFSFNKFPDVDKNLGPEMKSTGEVMGIDRSFEAAFLKSQMGVGMALPREGTVFVSVKNSDKPGIVEAVRTLINEGFRILATTGTQSYLSEQGLDVEQVNKVAEGRISSTRSSMARSH